MATLLVVDDEQDICDLVVKRLVRLGHQVLAAGDAVTALALVQGQGLPDAAVLDIDMPGMDGFELLNRLRELRAGVPVLFLTVLWNAEVHQRIQAVAATHVAKPFTATSLSAGVLRLLCPANDADAFGSNP